MENKTMEKKNQNPSEISRNNQNNQKTNATILIGPPTTMGLF